MSIRFEVQVRAFEEGQHAYDQEVRFELVDVAEPIAASQRMVDQFARNYHGIKDPTPTDVCNVTCNELFHLLRKQAAGDDRRTMFVAGSILRLCALPEDAPAFAGLGRHPSNGERLLLTIRRAQTGPDQFTHNSSITPVPKAQA